MSNEVRFYFDFHSGNVEGTVDEVNEALARHGLVFEYVRTEREHLVYRLVKDSEVST